MAANNTIDATRDAEALSAGTKTAGVASSIIFGRLISFLFIGISFIVVARILGNTAYGIYTIAIAAAGIFAGDLGLGYTINKFIGESIGSKKRKNIDAIFSNGLAFALLLGIVLTAIVFALSPAIAGYIFHSSSYTYVMQIASFTILLQMVTAVCYQSLIGFGRKNHIAAMLVLQAAGQAGVSIGLAVEGSGPVSPILGTVVGLASGAMFAFALIIRSGVSLHAPSLAKLREIFKFSMPVGVSNLFISVAINLTPVVLGLFVVSGVVGNFGVTSKTNTFINVFAESIGIALLPMFAAALSTKSQRKNVGRIFNYAVYASFVLITPLLFYLALLSKQFTFTVFSSSYALAPLYISIMSIGVVIGIIGIYAMMLMISANMVKRVLKYNGIIFAVQVITLIALTWAFKGVGAVSMLFLITPIITSALFLWGAYKHLGIRIEGRKLARVVIASAISVAFIVPLMLLLKDLYIPLLVSAAVEQILIYPIILSLLKGITSKDIGTLNKLMSGIPALGGAMGSMLKYAQFFMR